MRVRVSVRVRVRVTVRLRVTGRVREMGTAFYQIYMCKEPMAASPHHRQMAENEPLGDSNHKPSAYKAESLSIRAWLRCSKWAEFGTYLSLIQRGSRDGFYRGWTGHDVNINYV